MFVAGKEGFLEVDLFTKAYVFFLLSSGKIGFFSCCVDTIFFPVIAKFMPVYLIL